MHGINHDVTSNNTIATDITNATHVICLKLFLQTLSEGYFAIIMPRFQDVEKIISDLVPELDYQRS